MYNCKCFIFAVHSFFLTYFRKSKNTENREKDIGYIQMIVASVCYYDFNRQHIEIESQFSN